MKAVWMQPYRLPKRVPLEGLSPRRRWTETIKRLRCRHERQRCRRKPEYREAARQLHEAMKRGEVQYFMGFRFVPPPVRLLS